jgi:hypothetical protein
MPSDARRQKIYLNFDCIKATDMPTTDPRRFSFFTPDHKIDSIQPVSMPIPAMPSYADVQVRLLFFLLFLFAIILTCFIYLIPSGAHLQELHNSYKY